MSFPSIMIIDVSLGALFWLSSRFGLFQVFYDSGGPADPTKGLSVLILSVAMSIDALAVGFSFALSKTPVLYPSIVIAIVTFGMTACGILFGEKLGKIIGRRAEIFGGRC
ncbi:MAG TPA: manganese efflux pump [Syntrophales bacterium]|nr:manganese efflux pump [Syntrophales bacterium]